MDAQVESKGFVGALFDLKFRSFITLKFASLIYVIMIGVWALAAIAILFSFVGGGGLGVVIGLVGGPTVFLIGLSFSRIYLEVIVVLFRIAENTAEMVRRG